MHASCLLVMLLQIWGKLQGGHFREKIGQRVSRHMNNIQNSKLQEPRHKRI